MNAEILCIGTELLLGNIVNTNAAYLSQELAKLGINVYHHSVVGDNADRLKEALKLASNRADLIITTGGLGPTYDDLSKEMIAAHFGRKLVKHQPSMDRLREFYAARKDKTMTPGAMKQAQQPEGAVIFPNHSGTAPGAAIEEKGKIAILLPGPPRELQLMFETEVAPYLRQFVKTTIVSRNVQLFNIGESVVETILRDLMVSSENPTLAPYAKEGEVNLRLTASAATEEAGYRMIEPLLQQVKELVGRYIYGIDVPDLQTALVASLQEKNLTVSCAESCTGGLISKSITDVAGCSDVYLGGACTYSNQMKMDLLHVKPETLQRYGAVSEQTAIEMAQGIRAFTHSDLAVSTTGIAGPGGGTSEKPVGLVYIAVVGESYSRAERLHISYGEITTRDMIRQKATQYALFYLLEAAKEHREEK